MIPATFVPFGSELDMAAFRELRPSSDHVHPEEAQPSSAASSEAGGTNDPHSANPTRVRKRRAPTHVSQNACTNCKRARAKVLPPILSAASASPSGGRALIDPSPLVRWTRAGVMQQVSDA